MKRNRLGMLLAIAALTACQDLDTVNETQPDADRALAQPGDVESAIRSQFKVWMDNTHSSSPAWALSTAADEATSSWANEGMQQISWEPRTAYPNSTAASNQGVMTTPWFGMYRVLSSTNDGLNAIKKGMKFGTNGADTKRAEVFARFVQGLAHGWLALQFDKAFIYTEDIDVNSDKLELVDYKAVMAAAIKMLDQAAAEAQANTFTLPSDWINQQTFSNVEFARIAKSLSARFMTAVARTPEERAAVNWNDVITRINAGITRDFGFQADNSSWRDAYKERLQRFDWTRADYRTIGPADQSGNYQRWLATPVADRQPFNITTPDRRITGASPTTDGTDFYFRSTQNFAADRGSYHFSNYGHKRYLTIRNTQIGFVPLMNTLEMDLLKAEAYIRLNQPAQAVPLINKTRVARGQLPEVTVAGVSGATCVPRTATGACGNLMDALIYEKRLEAFGLAAGLAYFDARGWGYLLPGTLLHFPVPARELETLGLVAYTFGGVGGSAAAK
jgi:hypothetical protein